MIKVKVKNGNIERALKTYKRKFRNVGVVNELRERQEYTKPSEKRRKTKDKAIFINKKKNNDE
jgi:small subunit ribosomal protein S21